jgi:hypothetical protein
MPPANKQSIANNITCCNSMSTTGSIISLIPCAAIMKYKSSTTAKALKPRDINKTLLDPLFLKEKIDTVAKKMAIIRLKR